MASQRGKNTGGRPKASIHQLYTRVPDSKPSDPVYSCIGFELPVKGKQLYKLCEHSVLNPFTPGFQGALPADTRDGEELPDYEGPEVDVNELLNLFVEPQL
jgi:hypothetical protein